MGPDRHPSMSCRCQRPLAPHYPTRRQSHPQNAPVESPPRPAVLLAPMKRAHARLARLAASAPALVSGTTVLARRQSPHQRWCRYRCRRRLGIVGRGRQREACRECSHCCSPMVGSAAANTADVGKDRPACAHACVGASAIPYWRPNQKGLAAYCAQCHHGAGTHRGRDHEHRHVCCGAQIAGSSACEFARPRVRWLAFWCAAVARALPALIY